MIVFYVFCALIGCAAAGLMILTISKVKSKSWACFISCLLGITVAVAITILAVYMLPVTIAIAGGVKI
jgi:hypothetical protein